MSVDDPTQSGIKTSNDGSRYIGGSVRADGSVRITRKVRPGFVPLEDVPKYVPRARRTENARLGLTVDQGAILPKKVESADVEANDLVQSLSKLTIDTQRNEDRTKDKSVGTKGQSNDRAAAKDKSGNRKSEDDRSVNIQDSEKDKGEHENNDEGLVKNSKQGSKTTTDTDDKSVSKTMTKENIAGSSTKKDEVPKYMPPWKRQAMQQNNELTDRRKNA